MGGTYVRTTFSTDDERTVYHSDDGKHKMHYINDRWSFSDMNDDLKAKEPQDKDSICPIIDGYTNDAGDKRTGTIVLNPNATAAVVLECNDPSDHSVHLKAGIYRPKETPLASKKGWTKEGRLNVKTFELADMTKKFKTGVAKSLTLTATRTSNGCKKITVDNVEVCKSIGELYTFTCKYNMADQKISEDFSVTGQDTEATAQGTGTLLYTLTVNNDNVSIGEKVDFTIKPSTPDLVYATATECHVKYNTDEITIFGHNDPKCYTELVGAKWASNNPTASTKKNIQGSWTAFKWSTSTNKDDKESQTFECTIALSENEDTKSPAKCT